MERRSSQRPLQTGFEPTNRKMLQASHFIPQKDEVGWIRMSVLQCVLKTVVPVQVGFCKGALIAKRTIPLTLVNQVSSNCSYILSPSWL